MFPLVYSCALQERIGQTLYLIIITKLCIRKQFFSELRLFSTLLPVMAISCWGFVPEDLQIVFEPVMTTSPAERAELVQKLSSDVIEAFKCSLLTREQALEELKARGEELGVYTKV